jgi:biopolymer transport protein ExbD
MSQEESSDLDKLPDPSTFAPAGAKRKKKGKRGEEGGMSLNMNSLMDIMTIMLLFLLKNYGEDPLKVQGEDLKAPTSFAELRPEDALTISITQKSILIDDKKVVDVQNGAVDKSQKKGGETSLMIQPVFENLQLAIKKKKQEKTLLKQEYKPLATVIADQGTPYRLVQEVMFTAGQAELSQFKLAVIKSDRFRLGGSGTAAQ